MAMTSPSDGVDGNEHFPSWNFDAVLRFIAGTSGRGRPFHSLGRIAGTEAHQLVDPILLDLPSSIETSRLTLRPPRTGDGPALHEALAESLVELRRYLASLPWVAAEQTLESAETFCRNGEANFIARRDLPFFVFEKRTGNLVASAGLHRTVWQTPKTEVGYWCRTRASGHGFVTEAVSALTEYAFQHMRAVRVELITDEENAASRKVAERSGFVLEGILRNERRAPDASLRSTCVYARIANAA
jgi:RimJ/RimL family protein N-acetyltransferase